MIGSPVRVHPALRAACARARQVGRPVLASWTERVEWADPLAFFAGGAEEVERTYWERPDDGRAVVGLGTAWAVEPAGERRFVDLAAAWRSLLAEAWIELPDAAPSAAGPALLGGLAFDATRHDPASLPAPSPWRELPTGRFVLPRWQLTTAGPCAWLTTNVVVAPELDPEQAAASPRPRAELVPGDVVPGNGLALEDRLSAGEWMSLVAEAAREIAGGAFEKVVLARQVDARGGRPFDVVSALARLRSAYPSCTAFAIASGRFCFLGASPERLGRVEGGRADVSCLAGTAPRGETPAEDERIGRELMSSAKNRTEHAVVARTLRGRLAPLCRTLDVPDAPRLMKVRNVQHLYTPITGTLRVEVGPIELAEALHPTPAVGGYPDDRALPFIRARERLDRGWYAGPFGWVDARGNGDFAVALRSALLDEPVGGGFGRAHLYAGCGIVADSVPEAEYEESCLKLRPMLVALGGDG